jgi:hypothetical protein
MAYRFNGGKGGVTCDECNILFDENLSYEEYKKMYDKDDGKTYCWECKAKLKKKEEK